MSRKILFIYKIKNHYWKSGATFIRTEAVFKFENFKWFLFYAALHWVELIVLTPRFSTESQLLKEKKLTFELTVCNVWTHKLPWYKHCQLKYRINTNNALLSLTAGNLFVAGDKTWNQNEIWLSNNIGDKWQIRG